MTKEDLVNYATGKAGGASPAARVRKQRVPMTRMRARIAERLMQSKNSIAMLTSFNEVNLGKVMEMRKELGEQFEKANGIKLGFMSFFAKAAANALQSHPVVNASVDGNDVIYHGYADISIAVVDRARAWSRRCCATSSAWASPTSRRRIADYAKKAREGGLDARRPAGRHLHDHQRRHLRLADVHADRQPAAERDPGHARHQGARRSSRTARSSPRR